MALQFIFGPSGSGKSHYIYNRIIEESLENPKRQYLVLVPEQFTMQTQKELVMLHPRKGIMNIDVLSFERLAFRVLEETGALSQELLEETGKSMVLRKVAQEKKKELKILGSKMNKQGYVSQLKSMVSELRQYEIQVEDLDKLLEDVEDKPELFYKLKDIQTLYKGFFDYLEGKFITQEEVLDVLAQRADQSEKLKDSTVVLDGYTGFTPIQIQVMEKLLKLCRQVYIPLTMGRGEDPYRLGNPYGLFYLTRQTVNRLCKLAEETGTSWSEIWIPQKGEKYQGRFRNNEAMDYLERNIFRKNYRPYAGKEKAVFIREALNPQEEMEETACRIRHMVRKEGYRFGDFALVTGDMEVYSPAARRAFEKYGIPCFVDEKHSLFMNPFIEYIRSAVDMVVENFTYESVFRFLRCGLTDITEEETDRLENYVIAMGIRGLDRWDQEWVRSYRGEDPEECVKLNPVRQRLVDMWRPFAEGMKSPQGTIRTCCQALYEFICRNQIEKKLKLYEEGFTAAGEMAMAKEYSQIYRIVMDLLDKLVEVLGDEQVRPGAFKEILEAGLSEAKVGVIPPAADQVLVGDMERTRLKDIKILFFVGVNEGKIPKEKSGSKILSDLNREELEGPLERLGLALAPTAREELYTQKFYLYLNLTKPSERVYLTYSRLNGNGDVISPSYLVSQTEKLFPQARQTQEVPMYTENIQGALEQVARELGGRQEKSPVFQELYAWFQKEEKWKPWADRLVETAYYVNPQDAIGKAAAQVLYGRELENSATRLEQFARCACAHFLTYGLALKERARYQFTMADLGTLLHNSLDLFARKLREEGISWTQLEDGERDRLAEACVDQVVAQAGETVLLSSARNAYTVKRAKRMVKRTVWALQFQLRQGRFFPALTEWAFGPWDNISSLDLELSPEEILHLTGRIDRIDLCRENGKVYVKVIDYKSGNTQLDPVKMYYGLQLQLALYLSAAVELEQRRFPNEEIIPAGIFYYNIKDPVLNREDVKDPEHPDREILKKLKMDGLAAREPEILERLDKDLAAGKSIESLAVPVKYTAKGTLAGNSRVADQEQFSTIMNYVNYKAKEIGQEILQGKVEVNPFAYQKECACDYCPYRNICGFDEKIPGYSYRRLGTCKPEEIWEKMKAALKNTTHREEE